MFDWKPETQKEEGDQSATKASSDTAPLQQQPTSASLVTSGSQPSQPPPLSPQSSFSSTPESHAPIALAQTAPAALPSLTPPLMKTALSSEDIVSQTVDPRLTKTVTDSPSADKKPLFSRKSTPVLTETKEDKTSRKFSASFSSKGAVRKENHTWKIHTWPSNALPNCGVCQEALWGSVRQGSRCEICGFCVHEKCRDKTTVCPVSSVQSNIDAVSPLPPTITALAAPPVQVTSASSENPQPKDEAEADSDNEKFEDAQAN